MKPNIRIKKEVSCKTLTPVFNAAREKNIELKELLQGVPYNLAYLLNKRERIEWGVWCRIYNNSKAYFTPLDYEQMGKNFVKNGAYLEGVLAAYFIFSSNKILRFLSGHFAKAGNNNFSCVEMRIEYPGINNVRITGILSNGYEFSDEFFLIAKGVGLQLGKQIGHKEFKLNFSWINNGAVFDISWERESILFSLKRRLLWMFNFKKAVIDLTNSHEQLQEQYNKLEESKLLLQKQTTQLKTAHEITKLIRQSLDINETLNTIAEVLVKEADFSCVYIKLYKDIEGNKFEIETWRGIKKINVKPYNRDIIINNEIIGQIVLFLKPGIENSVFEELFNYLLPIINISIHDSLVLRAVTDYRNNLEFKVEERTAELKKAQKDLSKIVQVLRETEQSRNRFFTNISHEFRTPLTLILGRAEQVIEQVESDNVKEKVKLIHRSAGKLNRLANQLLDLAKIEAGKMKFETNLQNLIPIIEEIVSSFQSFAETKKISLKFICANELLFIYLDRDKFDQILSNIISNALKFTPQGGIVEVKVVTPTFQTISKTESNDGFVEISVSDTGIGIPTEQLNKIFDRFYQVNNSLFKEFEGTGVGLSLTKELIDLHKGKIIVESREGKGSTFRILLPAYKENPLPGEIIKELGAAKKNACNYKILDAGKYDFPSEGKINEKKNIVEDFKKDALPLMLIVEDNPDVRSYISDITAENYKIIEAKDGEEGIKESFEHLPDIIISDVMMPKTDGFQLCKKLKNDARTSHIPVILLTAKSTLDDKIEGFKTGADSYIMKPFKASELKERVKNLLQQRKRIHEHFRNFGFVKIDERNISSVDQIFLKRVIEIIDKNISDQQFGITALAGDLAVSRSLLHKKVTTLTGEPPGELIKRLRLNKAANLLEHNAGNITQIAYESGFNDPAYFAVCFKKQFGVSPTHYNKNN